MNGVIVVCIRNDTMLVIFKRDLFSYWITLEHKRQFNSSPSTHSHSRTLALTNTKIDTHTTTEADITFSTLSIDSVTVLLQFSSSCCRFFCLHSYLWYMITCDTLSCGFRKIYFFLFLYFIKWNDVRIGF